MSPSHLRLSLPLALAPTPLPPSLFLPATFPLPPFLSLPLLRQQHQLPSPAISLLLPPLSPPPASLSPSCCLPSPSLSLPSSRPLPSPTPSLSLSHPHRALPASRPSPLFVASRGNVSSADVFSNTDDSTPPSLAPTSPPTSTTPTLTAPTPIAPKSTSHCLLQHQRLHCPSRYPSSPSLSLLCCCLWVVASLKSPAHATCPPSLPPTCTTCPLSLPLTRVTSALSLPLHLNTFPTTP